MRIQYTSRDDLDHVLRIHRSAFGQELEAALVRDILEDASAQPSLSLMAQEEGRPIGHLLFSNARLSGSSSKVPAALLAPLAVMPEAQGRGVGGALIRAGLEELRRRDVALVFVLGDPAFYGRFGFEAAARRKLTAPFPLPEAYANAWMVKDLRTVPGAEEGSVQCCASLSRPELWQE